MCSKSIGFPGIGEDFQYFSNNGLLGLSFI